MKFRAMTVILSKKQQERQHWDLLRIVFSELNFLKAG